MFCSADWRKEGSGKLDHWSMKRWNLRKLPFTAFLVHLSHNTATLLVQFSLLVILISYVYMQNISIVKAGSKPKSRGVKRSHSNSSRCLQMFYKMHCVYLNTSLFVEKIKPTVALQYINPDHLHGKQTPWWVGRKWSENSCPVSVSLGCINQKWKRKLQWHDSHQVAC